MIYPYHCKACDTKFVVRKHHEQASEPEECPSCEAIIEYQDYKAKNVRGHLSTEGDWTGGKMITQLPAWHKDYRVTNRNDMADAYQRNGICMDTGKFVSKEAQIKATLPQPAQEAALANPDLVVGGLREEG